MLKRLAKSALQYLSFNRGAAFARKFPASIAPAAASTPGELEAYFDSIVEGPGLWKWRHYFDAYQRHFSRFKGQEVHVVEVGIYSGGSLPMWQKFFGPKAHIYGVDIEEACQVYAGDQIKVFIGDQANRDFWKDFRQQVPRVDILIDDGGHTPKQQRITLEEMLPHLQPGGVYFCEDIHGGENRFSSYVSGMAQELNKHLYVHDHPDWVNTNLLQRSIHSIHLYPYCAVIEKTAGQVEKLFSEKHGTQWQPFL